MPAQSRPNEASGEAVAPSKPEGVAKSIGSAYDLEADGVVALKHENADSRPDTDGAETAVPLISASDDWAINTQLQDHAAHVDDWEYGPIAAELNTWLQRFNSEFLLDALPPAAVSLEPARVDCLGWYLPDGRDGLGLRYRININSLHVERSRALVLAVLLHEALHLWEEVVCGRRAVRGNYHTVKFCRKAAELGIPTDRNGVFRGIAEGSPFVELLRRHGVAFDDELKDSSRPPGLEPKLVAKGPGSRLAKWDCGCTKVYASSGVSVSAICGHCGHPFVRCPWTGGD